MYPLMKMSCLEQSSKGLFVFDLRQIWKLLMGGHQSPMQSCRSLQSLSISANVSKVVQLNGWFLAGS